MPVLSLQSREVTRPQVLTPAANNTHTHLHMCLCTPTVLKM